MDVFKAGFTQANAEHALFLNTGAAQRFGKLFWGLL